MVHLTPTSRSGSGRKRRNSALNSTINITPLVDVMLVLMVIFMVAAPMLSLGGINVNLPKTTAESLKNSTDTPLIISIDAEKRLYLQDSPCDFETVVGKLTAIFERDPGATLLIRADKSITYGEVIQVMGKLAEAGFQKVSLIVDQPATIMRPKS